MDRHHGPQADIDGYMEQRLQRERRRAASRQRTLLRIAPPRNDAPRQRQQHACQQQNRHSGHKPSLATETAEDKVRVAFRDVRRKTPTVTGPTPGLDGTQGLLQLKVSPAPWEQKALSEISVCREKDDEQPKQRQRNPPETQSLTRWQQVSDTERQSQRQRTQKSLPDCERFAECYPRLRRRRLTRLRRLHPDRQSQQQHRRNQNPPWP